MICNSIKLALIVSEQNRERNDTQIDRHGETEGFRFCHFGYGNPKKD